MKRKESLSELRGLTIEKLKEKAAGVSEELMKLRFRNAMGQLEQSHMIGSLKKELARIKTVITENEKSGAAA